MTAVQVSAFTKGLTTPSARFRVRQLIGELHKEQILIEEYPAWVSEYRSRPVWQWPLLASGTMIKRVPDLIKSYKSDISFLQRELFSTWVTLEPLLKHPLVLDVDDAIFLRRQGKAAKRLAQIADHIVCGNTYLADFFSQHNERVTIIPTAIDIERFHILPVEKEPEQFVIGWIGTSGNFRYLYEIESALLKIVTQRPATRIKIIADRAPAFSAQLRAFMDFEAWSTQTEVAGIQSFSVGIMPLREGEWEQGKCSFKMLQYMACGLPVVVSPVGMNQEVLNLGECGLAARSENDWVDQVISLIDSTSLIKQFGQTGRSIVEQHFSTKKIAKDLASVFRSVI